MKKLFLSLLFYVLASVACAQVPVQTWNPPIQFPAQLQGMRADRLGVALNGHSPDTIILEGGSFASANGVQVFSFTQTIYVDPLIQGPCGRDQSSLWSSGQAVYMFLITTDTQVCGVLSASADYGNVQNFNPATGAGSGPFIGWILQRKHPFAMNWWTWYGSTPGFANFHYSGTQNPWIMFRDVAETPRQFIRGDNTGAALVCRKDWIPSMVPTGSSRMLRVQTGLYIPAGYSAVSGFVGPLSNSLVYAGTFTGIPSSEIRAMFDMLIQSDGTYCFKSYGSFDVTIMGYQITEVTD